MPPIRERKEVCTHVESKKVRKWTGKGAQVPPYKREREEVCTHVESKKVTSMERADDIILTSSRHNFFVVDPMNYPDNLVAL